MGKHFRCVIDICDNDMHYPQLHKKHSNVNGGIIMHKLPKDGAIKAAWINTIKGKKQSIQESLRTFVTASQLGWLNLFFFNKIYATKVTTNKTVNNK